MANLQTTYMGLDLRNPLIVGSCGITRNVEGVRTCYEAGAGAVVLKSLFEEEIRLAFSGTDKALESLGPQHSEAWGYLESDLAAHYGADGYLALVEGTAKAVPIPVIASINCSLPGTWASYARKLEAAGAAAIELNIYVLPTDPTVSSDTLEQTYVAAAASVVNEVGIPVAVKLVPYVTNPVRMALGLQEAGVRALVLFNRFFHPDIDLESRKLGGALSLSTPDEYRLPLRWTALLSGRLSADLCASTGIHDGATLLKLLLAGASAVQMTSALYIHKLSHISQVLSEIDSWLDANGLAGVSEIVGRLSRTSGQDVGLLERAQYIKAFVGHE